MSRLQPRLGFCPDVGDYLWISHEANWLHMLFTGKTKGGKTVALYKVASGITQEGGAVGILNYSGAFDQYFDVPNVKVIDIASEGIPFNFLTPLKRKTGVYETPADVVDAAVELFQSVSRMPIRQKAEFRKAVSSAVQHITIGGDALLLIRQALESSEQESAEKVLDRYAVLFSRIKTVRYKEPLFTPGKMTIFDFSGFPRSGQFMAAEFLLAILWRYFQVYGQRLEFPLFLICDEFHNLRHDINSTIADILREGRKFNMALLLATQTLKTFDPAERAILSQASTRLCFRPDPWDIKDILRGVEVEEKNRLNEELNLLKTGECLGVGDFECQGYAFSKKIKMTFRTDS